MLMVISPAKRLDFKPAPAGLPSTRPELVSDAAELARIARRLSADDIKGLMHVSDSLADLNRERFQALDPKCDEGGLQAALAFAGDVYIGMDSRTLAPDALGWLQDRLRILSGLYGVLRPLDCIQPHRLEMGTRLKTRRGQTLYDFWGDRIGKALRKAAEGHEDPTIVNLASHEYFGAVDRRALKRPIVTCLFREERNGETRTIGVFAKVARGRMVRYAADRRIDRAEGVKDFDAAGYRYRPEASSASEWVFVRPQPESAAA